MRIWIAGGGTGGHVYPGLSVVQALTTLPAVAARADEGTEDAAEDAVEDAVEDASGDGALECIYVGAKGKVEERLAVRAGLRFIGVPAGGVHGLPLGEKIWNLTKLVRGWLAACLVGLRERPGALFATGGYASIPAALAAWTLRVPILLYLPDIEPGWAVHFIGRLATRVAVTVEDSQAYFSAQVARKILVSGYPVRGEFHTVDRGQARASLGLAEDEPALLVMGGSIGAQGINRALDEILEQVLDMVQVVHISGELDWPRVQERREALPADLKGRYHIYDYVHEIGKAFAAADLAICRAGASVLGELPFFGLPAVLVPYPYAWRYQRINADWLAERGAAVRLDEDRLSEELLPMLCRLFGEGESLAAMAGHMQALARPGAAEFFAEELCRLQGIEAT